LNLSPEYHLTRYCTQLRSMGSAASALPEKMTEEELKNACGDRYNPVYYTALKDADHMVSRDLFIAVATEGHEKEVFDLFLSFCHGGEIDSRTFIKLLKDTKSLNKKKFSSGDADLIFQKHKTKQGTSAKALSYNVFRNGMVPDIAAKKEISVEKYIAKLAECEGPHLHATHAQANRFHDDKSTYTGAHAQGGPSFEPKTDLQDNLDRSAADVRGIKIKGEDIEVTDAHHSAALKVQNIHRKKEAKRRVDTMREIKKDAENVDPDSFDKPGNSESENALKQVFLKFCPTGEMDSKTFIKLLRDATVINRKFTATDGDLIFQKTKAKASAPSAGSYSSGVVHGKRVNFDVFRAVAIPLIAEKKGMNVSALVEHIADCSGPTLHGTTSAAAVRLHDDPSTYTGARAAAEAPSA